MKHAEFGVAFTELVKRYSFSEDWWENTVGLDIKTFERWKDGADVPHKKNWDKFREEALRHPKADTFLPEQLEAVGRIIEKDRSDAAQHKRTNRNRVRTTSSVRDLASLTSFTKVYGSDSTIYLIYSELTINPLVPKIIDAYGRLVGKSKETPICDQKTRSELTKKPMVTYDQQGRHGIDGYHFRAEHSACVCEVRGAAYVAASLSQFSLPRFPVVGNVHPDVHNKSDLSFVAFGTLINSKSQELLADPRALVGFAGGCFVSNRLRYADRRRDRRRPLHMPVEEGDDEDYGVIVRIQPSTAPAKNGRVWIACGGVGQHGTSAAAWVLAERWAEIADQLVLGTGNFLCLIRARKSKGDQFAELKWVAERVEDLQRHEQPR